MKEKEKMLIRIKKGRSLSSSVCEWNPGNGRWYPVSRDNMEIEGDLKLQSNLMNALLAGCVAKIRGSYSRKHKKLRLTL